MNPVLYFLHLKTLDLLLLIVNISVLMMPFINNFFFFICCNLKIKLT